MEHKKLITGLVIIPCIVICVVIVLVIVTLSMNNPTEFFRNMCEARGGDYFELQNTSCQVGYRNCILNCEIDGEIINYYEKDKLIDNSTT